jgi:hypothetical protein
MAWPPRIYSRALLILIGLLSAGRPERISCDLLSYTLWWRDYVSLNIGSVIGCFIWLTGKYPKLS